MPDVRSIALVRSAMAKALIGGESELDAEACKLISGKAKGNPFFTEQFSGLTLADDGYLSAPVDGITGATLSVRATEKVARLALWLDAQVRG